MCSYLRLKLIRSHCQNHSISVLCFRFSTPLSKVKTLVTPGTGRGNGMSVRSDLPPPMIEEIFAKLPVKSLCRFMSLSKSYFKLIASRRFFRAHLLQSNQINKQFLLQINELPLTLQSMSFDGHQVLREPMRLVPDHPLLSHWRWKMIGSCNGVLCLKNSEQFIPGLAILNPSFKKFQLVYIPTLMDYSGDGTSFSTEIGFGFDSCTSDFKIVIIFQESRSKIWRQVQVYSLRNKEWKILSNFPNGPYHLFEPKLVVNGAVYWVVKSGIDGFYSILLFDFTDETFKEIRMPDCFYADLGCKVDGIGEVKGKLSLLFHRRANSSEDGVPSEMWMMEDSGWVRQFVVNGWQYKWLGMNDEVVLMMEDSDWVRQFVVYVWQFHAPICLGMNDEVMLLMTRYYGGHIFSCDLKTLELTYLGVQEQRRRPFTYTPSLAFLEEEN